MKKKIVFQGGAVAIFCNFASARERNGLIAPALAVNPETATFFHSYCFETDEQISSMVPDGCNGLHSCNTKSRFYS
ncbi:hypothetical protein CEXT_777381 [Caerostris extrusa]|uniref:Uncharacterized protein n=1 Tax=Caerostris extrusa TaxID=172846 RepID=A0AAV4NDQ7_CAEEX|nr:hypothetical protein CEXT_777381 [Caerostris extrusa]